MGTSLLHLSLLVDYSLVVASRATLVPWHVLSSIRELPTSITFTSLKLFLGISLPLLLLDEFFPRFKIPFLAFAHPLCCLAPISLSGNRPLLLSLVHLPEDLQLLELD